MPAITIRLPKFISIGHPVIDLRSGRSGSPRADILSGLTVALALVPEAVAFAFLAGVPPLVGLYAAFIICLLTSILGGRPGMISGATGAMGVVVVSLVAEHGIGYLFPAVVLCGLLQIVVGLFKLGRFIRIVPHPVMLGFVNGLAVVILLAQLGSFKTLNADGVMAFLSGSRLWLMLGLVAATMAIIAFLPKLTRAVPASLAAIVLVSIAAFAINASAGKAPEGEADGATAARPLLTVGDMLLDSTRAAAVRTGAAGQGRGGVGGGGCGASGGRGCGAREQAARRAAHRCGDFGGGCVGGRGGGGDLRRPAAAGVVGLYDAAGDAGDAADHPAVFGDSRGGGADRVADDADAGG
ncbi:MAG: SulP family inorganic anion transporter [Planctomycetota bacterium]|nr:MAG: SulP family inorganic anion transporter [Planctomycetota bacterium]